MNMVTLLPQSSSDYDSSLPNEYRGFENSEYLELSEIGQCLSLDFATPQDTEKVFREGQISLEEEVMMVLKRANPVIEGIDEYDCADSPVAKRFRMTSFFKADDNKNDYAESDEATLTSESTEDYEGNSDLIDCQYFEVAKSLSFFDTDSSKSLIILSSHSE
jgi:hypothetical protein